MYQNAGMINNSDEQSDELVVAAQEYGYIEEDDQVININNGKVQNHSTTFSRNASNSIKSYDSSIVENETNDKSSNVDNNEIFQNIRDNSMTNIHLIKPVPSQILTLSKQHSTSPRLRFRMLDQCSKA